MKTRLLEFIDQLRGAGVRASVGETLDALAAVGAIGVEREAIRAGLAATLVKDQAERATFDALFDRFFAVLGHTRGKENRPQPTGEGSGRGHGTPSPEAGRRNDREPRQRGPTVQPGDEHERRAAHDRHATEQAAQRRVLLEVPFEAMDPRAIEAADALVAELSRRLRAYRSRRLQRARRGRLDFRRTIRASLGSGGVPVLPAFRTRRPGKLDLVALCDLSHSTATAARFCLALLAPAGEFFRRVRLFGYVDRLVEISFERGHVVPHEPIDLAARSDFGQVLRQLWERWEAQCTRNTLLLILGDARNNRRPPRADILARLGTRVRRIVWLNPEPISRWNTGDSVIDLYAKPCDTVFTAVNLRELAHALKSAD